MENIQKLKKHTDDRLQRIFPVHKYHQFYCTQRKTVQPFQNEGNHLLHLYVILLYFSILRLHYNMRYLFSQPTGSIRFYELVYKTHQNNSLQVPPRFRRRTQMFWDSGHPGCFYLLRLPNLIPRLLFLPSYSVAPNIRPRLPLTIPFPSSAQSLPPGTGYPLPLNETRAYKRTPLLSCLRVPAHWYQYRWCRPA